MSRLGKQIVEETPRLATGALVGTHERTLDPKKRLTIPSAWRHALGSDYLYVMKEEGMPCLRLVPKGVFESRLTDIQEKDLSDEELNNVLEKIGEDSELLEFDVQGRIRISDRLLAYANLEGTVVMKGALRMARLWAPKNVLQRTPVEVENLRTAMKKLRF